VVVRAAVAADHVGELVRRTWGSSVMVVDRRVFDCAQLPALVAVDGGRVVGVLAYAVTDGELEIIACEALVNGRGVGRSLVEGAMAVARESGARRLRCTTTNDNLSALGFWQAVGFSLAALRRNAVSASRAIKPDIPLVGQRGLPIRDEIDLERLLD